MNIQKVFETMEEKNWTAELSCKGLWAVGPEQADGSLMVLGMAPTVAEAVEMALRSNNGQA